MEAQPDPELLHVDDDLPDPIGGDLPQDVALESEQHRPKQLSRCLVQWKDNEDEVGSLGCMLPASGFFTLQVIEISMVDGEPTGAVVLHDGEAFVPARVDPRYVVELKKRRWGKYSLLQIKATSGLHNNLTIVGFI